MEILFLYPARVRGVDYTYPQTLETSSAIAKPLIAQGIAICVSIAGVLNSFAIIPFTSSALPTITGYQATYAAIYGEYPNVECWMVDGDLRTQLMQPPNFTTVLGLIDTIYFDLGFELTGFIKIS